MAIIIVVCGFGGMVFLTLITKEARKHKRANQARREKQLKYLDIFGRLKNQLNGKE